MVVLQALPELLSKYTLLVGQVAEFGFVALLLYLPGRFIILPIVRWVFERKGFEPTIERTVEKLLHVGIVIGAIAIGAWAAGFGAFLGGSALIFAALTLAVGFAAQDVLSNFVAGVFIVQDRNFNIGDWIEWDDQAGYIDDIGFRVTRVRTFNNETVTVPNTELATNAVTNRMSNETLRIAPEFGIGYDDSIDAATRVLLNVAESHDGILTEPAPSVRVAELSDAAVLLQARFWIADPDREEFSTIRSQFIQTAIERCKSTGIDLSTTSQHALSGELAVSDATLQEKPE